MLPRPQPPFTQCPAVPVVSMFKEIGSVWRTEDGIFDSPRRPVKRSRNDVQLVTICGPVTHCTNTLQCYTKFNFYTLSHPCDTPRVQLETMKSKIKLLLQEQLGHSCRSCHELNGLRMRSARAAALYSGATRESPCYMDSRLVCQPSVSANREVVRVQRLRGFLEH